MSSRKHPSVEDPRFADARPLIGAMRSAIRHTLHLCPTADAEALKAELFKRFVTDGLVEEAEWSEDLVYSMALAEVDAMWAKAEVV